MDDTDRYDTMDGQVALVTGATRGIGTEIANRLAERGATVYAGARDPADVTATDREAVELDVTDDGTIRAAVRRVDDEAGRLDVLVNNAGIAGPEEPLHEVDVAGIDDTLAVNLRGPVVLARHALPLLLERPGGRVVNVSSGMGALGEGMSGSYGPYRVSKAGINALSVYLHGEYGDRGLIANSACPGWVRTDLGSPDAPNSPAEGADTPAWLATFRPGAPSGRFWRDREPIAW
jgi:NAD(P)-dependent dehydrogenase (short-subunit alcohol dehydrogenase family)